MSKWVSDKGKQWSDSGPIKISSWTQHSRVRYTLHADYRLQNRYMSVGEPKKRGASYWGERANNEKKVKKWRERWERCEIMKKIIFVSQTFSREIRTNDEKEARKFSKWSFLADGTCLRWMWAKNEKKRMGEIWVKDIKVWEKDEKDVKMNLSAGWNFFLGHLVQGQ